jgi:hypothetical protein
MSTPSSPCKKRPIEADNSCCKCTSPPANPPYCFNCDATRNVSVAFYCDDLEGGKEEAITFCATCVADEPRLLECLRCDEPFLLEAKDAVLLDHVVRRSILGNPTEPIAYSDDIGYYHRSCLTKTEENPVFHCPVPECQLTTWLQGLGGCLFSVECPNNACDSCHNKERCSCIASL